MVAFTVNGQRKEVGVDGNTPLLWVLREHLGLTGTKYGCGEGQCGACTVLIDGKPARSCRTDSAAAANKGITTIEGLAHLVAEYYGRPIRTLPGPPADGAANRRCPDITKMMRLGYQPKFTLRQALPAVVRWYDEHSDAAAGGR